MMLPALVGIGRALELAWTSDRIDAKEAYRIGLVNRVVPSAELAAQTEALANQLAAMPALALGLTKRAFNETMLPNLAAWLDDEAELQEHAAAGPDHREGVAAFIEKRAPAFGVVRT
jgi:2-(1,2-epoxy-1,2-dihydrophenyl)acetyl-CoA isomerase